MRHFKEYFLENKDHKRSIKFDIFIFILIFLSAAIYVIETSEPSAIVLQYTGVLDWIFNIIFSLEIIFRLYYNKDRKKFISSIYFWIDLIAILPFWLGAGNFIFLRSLRFIRIFRFLRFFKFSKRIFGYHHVSEKKSEADNVKRMQNLFFMKVFFTIFLFIYVFASIIYFVEAEANSGINQFSDALYFIWISVLAVGYGDIVPVTQVGKLITMIGSMIGVSIIPFHLGNFIRMTNDYKHHKHHTENKLVKVKYKFCSHCGEEIVDELQQSNKQEKFELN